MAAKKSSKGAKAKAAAPSTSVATDVADQIKALGKEAFDDLMASLGNSVVLDTKQQGILKRATERIAGSYILAIGVTDPDTLAKLQQTRDRSEVTVSGLEVANAVLLQKQLQASVSKVLSRALQILLGALSAYTGGMAGAVAGAVGAAVSPPGTPNQ